MQKLHVQRHSFRRAEDFVLQLSGCMSKKGESCNKSADVTVQLVQQIVFACRIYMSSVTVANRVVNFVYQAAFHCQSQKYMSKESPTQSVYSVVAHLEQPRVEECGFCVSRQNRWLTPCPWGGQPAFLARGACRALDSRAFQMHRSQLVASLTWTHNFSCQNLRVFGGKIICLRKRSEVSDGVSFVLA